VPDFQQFAARTRLLDGAWATAFYGNGLLPGSCAELFMARNPERIVQLGRDYLAAGAEALTTNSFQANRYALLPRGAADRAAELAEQAATLARRAAGPDVPVLGSMGPSGRILMAGQVSTDRLFSAYAEAAEALQWGGADALVLETFSELQELTVACRAAGQGADLPIIACMSFDAGQDNLYTQLGVKPEQLAKLADRMGLDAVGANCGTGPQAAVKIARRLLEATDLPVWIKPNAGLPKQLPGGVMRWPAGPDEMARCALELGEMGVTFVGGCCGTGPEHVRAMRAALDGQAGA
jgi:5-methyltetrahydrofolate--homocysteine methyltransferase